MRSATRLLSLTSLCLAAAMPLPACEHATLVTPAPAPQVVVREHGGPPPHAPAHGYRRKHQDAHGEVELVFDAGLGVYAVVGLPGVYFYADHFFRQVDAGWQISVQHDAGWVVAAEADVPPGLHGKAQGKAKKPHPVPAKRRD